MHGIWGFLYSKKWSRWLLCNGIRIGHPWLSWWKMLLRYTRCLEEVYTFFSKTYRMLLDKLFWLRLKKKKVLFSRWCTSLRMGKQDRHILLRQNDIVILGVLSWEISYLIQANPFFRKSLKFKKFFHKIFFEYNRIRF